DEANTAIRLVIPHQSAGNRVHHAKRFSIGRAVWFERAPQDFHCGTCQKSFSGDGTRWERERKLHTVAGLVRGEVLDCRGHRRRRRNGLTGSAAPERKQEHGKEKIENGKDLRGASRDGKCRPFSIFHFHELQNVAAQVLVLDDVRELFGNVSGVNLHVLFLQVRRFEGDFVEYLFEDGVK